MKRSDDDQYELDPNTPPEEYAYDSEEELVDDTQDGVGSRRVGLIRKVLYAGLVLFIIAAFVKLALYAYEFTAKPTDINQLKIVEADKEPYKKKPEDPGGMEVPFMDKTIYDSISDNKDAEALPKVERILPAPEEPIARPDPAYQDVIEKAKQDEAKKEEAAKPAPVKETKAEIAAKLDDDQTATAIHEGLSKVEEAAKAPAVETKVPAVKPVETPKVTAPKPISEKDLKVVPEKAPIEAPKPVKTSGTRIQLGAFKSEKIAADDWKRLQRLHPEVLGKLNFSVERKDLGDKGIFYRLQAGPFDSGSEARLVCKKLIEKQQGCFVVESN